MQAPQFDYINCSNLPCKTMKPKKLSDKDPKESEMKKGEYQLHVLLEASSGLCLSTDNGIDALVEVRALGTKQITDVKKKIGNQFLLWNEHFYFNATFQSNEIISKKTVVLSVYDYNRVLRDSLLGFYEINLKRIYLQKDHKMEHQWIALSNPSEDYEKIAGYLKISVSLIGEQDPSCELKLEPMSNLGENNMKVLVSPAISRKTYQVDVDVLKGRNLKPADWGKTIDSYIVAQFGQIGALCNAVPQNRNPDYYERISLPISIPTAINYLKIRLMDMNIVQKQQIIGTCYFDFEDVINNAVIRHKDGCEWINFYGPQIVCKDNKYKSMYQIYPDTAPYYAGSVLLAFNAKENSQPEKRITKLSLQHVKEAYRSMGSIPVFYRVTIDLTAGINLHPSSKKYRVAVRFGPYEIETEHSDSKGGFCFWGKKLAMTASFFSNQQIPHLFVYLVNHKNEKVCFSRHVVAPESDQVLEDRWVNLKPDRSVVDYQEQEAGCLKMGIKMAKATGMNQNSISELDHSRQMRNIYADNRNRGKFVIQLISINNLLPLDEEGTSDPFVVFNFLGKECMSNVQKETLNPVFMQKILVDTDVPLDTESCSPITVKVYDQDKLSKELIGVACLDIDDLIRAGGLTYNKSQSPHIIDIPITTKDIPAGIIKASFRLYTSPHQFSIPRYIDVPMSEYKIILVIIGLRNLRSSGVKSVTQPYLEFDLNAFSLFAKAHNKKSPNYQNYRTEPSELGNSVNICTVVTENIVLPSNASYWPNLSAKVTDNVISTLYQPTLGYFSIDLQQAHARCQKMTFRSNSRDEDQNMRMIPNRAGPQGPQHRQILQLHTKLLKSQSITQNEQGVSHLKNVIIFPNYQEEEIASDKVNKKNRNNSSNNSTSNINNSNNNPTEFAMTELKHADRNSKKSGMKYVQKFKNLIVENGEYMAIGYDDNKSRASSVDNYRKHYRFVLDCTYEELMQTEINFVKEIKIRSGKTWVEDEDSFLDYFRRQVTKEDLECGTYKGNALVLANNRDNIQKEQLFRKEADKFLKIFLKKQKITLFLYIIDAANLPNKDISSHSDPYLVIKSGDIHLDFSDEYVEDSTNPEFNKKVKIELEFPENSIVEIELWDYDPLKGDDFIGSVSVDIENRLKFSGDEGISWENPIESHNLATPYSKISQGILRFWLDLVPDDMLKVYKEFNIEKKPKSNFEVRVIVWNCTEIPSDDFEDVSDLYVVCEFNGEVQETDVHYRSATNRGSFNWRMIFQIELPTKNPLITFRVYDKDVFSRNDYLASGSFSIQNYLQEAFETDRSSRIYLGRKDFSLFSEVKTGKSRYVNGEKRYDRFNISLKGESGDSGIFSDDEENKLINQGKVEVSIEILTPDEAKRKPAGKGRSNPNQNPYLPEPKGRFEFSLNPLKMISQLCGPEFKAKICLTILVTVFIGILVYSASSFGGAFLGTVLGG